MVKLKIQNFGPIKNGFIENDGFLEFTPVTLFCGNQATGKSTIAKLYSTLSWVEKSFVKQDLFNFLTNEIVTIPEDFFVNNLKKQKLDEYFSNQTIIEYKGQAYNFKYENGEFSYSKSATFNEYVRPKIMYIPSDRNLLTSLEEADKVKNLPEMLSIMFDEYNLARKRLNGTGYALPISNIKIKNDKERNSIRVITGENSSISIYNASSGIQSVTPLSLVTRSIAFDIFLEEKKGFQDLSAYERELFKRKFFDESKIPNDLKPSMMNYTEHLFNYYTSIDKGNKLLKNFFNRCFINIVEEPEQNLYPDSQGQVLYELLEYLNWSNENRLVITTHSPYILSYLTLSAKAAELKNKSIPKEKINKLVPFESVVSGNKISVYETQENGSVIKLKTYDNLPSDNNMLNNALDNSNEIFAQLIELEDEYHA